MSSKRYPEAFKIEAVRQVVERDHSVAEVASRLGYYRIAWILDSVFMGSRNLRKQEN